MAKKCPLLKKSCIEHDCAWYIHLIGKDPNTGKEKDEFACSVALLPTLMINVANETRMGNASVVDFRNGICSSYAGNKAKTRA